MIAGDLPPGEERYFARLLSNLPHVESHTRRSKASETPDGPEARRRATKPSEVAKNEPEGTYRDTPLGS
jgi:hypothetical protein